LTPVDQTIRRDNIGAHSQRLINETKNTLEGLISDQKNNFKEHARKWFDPTMPAEKITTGKLHFLTRAIDEISSTFEKIGFTRVRYPEVEWDHYAFGALNFPDNHPARDDWETFFIDQDISKKYGPMLLTPHTSSGQIREMEENIPPIRMINIAKCYRRQIDARHCPMFHQFEGLVVDKNISDANNKQLAAYKEVKTVMDDLYTQNFADKSDPADCAKLLEIYLKKYKENL
jgi:phenylalanyl-tRNA synthetase alpha chain